MGSSPFLFLGGDTDYKIKWVSYKLTHILNIPK